MGCASLARLEAGFTSLQAAGALVGKVTVSSLNSSCREDDLEVGFCLGQEGKDQGGGVAETMKGG